jgi:hypothetical protein
VVTAALLLVLLVLLVLLALLALLVPPRRVRDAQVP